MSARSHTSVMLEWTLSKSKRAPSGFFREVMLALVRCLIRGQDVVVPKLWRIVVRDEGWRWHLYLIHEHRETLLLPVTLASIVNRERDKQRGCSVRGVLMLNHLENMSAFQLLTGEAVSLNVRMGKHMWSEVRMVERCESLLRHGTIHKNWVPCHHETISVGKLSTRQERCDHLFATCNSPS